MEEILQDDGRHGALTSTTARVGHMVTAPFPGVNVDMPPHVGQRHILQD